jgi:hypothetical protein
MKDIELSRVLKQHDPAAGRRLDPDKAAAIKRAALAAISDEEASGNWWPALGAVTALLVFVVATLLLVNRPGPSRRTEVATQTASAETVQPPPANTDRATGVRQIQYTTEGGTRIIWTIDPDFEL